jgi:hypothetical protein
MLGMISFRLAAGPIVRANATRACRFGVKR